jgi:hypothetical protein
MYVAGTDPFTGFLSNFLATLGGVALGVPTALYLASRESRKREADEKQLATRHRDEVLTIVGCELLDNRTTLRGRRDEEGSRSLQIPFLMDEVWSAVSDGGQLAWVADDAELLRRLARAYVFVRTIIFLERQLFESTHQPGAAISLQIQRGGESRRISTGEIAAEKFKPYLEHQDVMCLAAIDEALAAIHDRLGHEVACPD